MTKTNIHKWVAILVSFLMIGTLFSMLPITNLTASAISCQKDGFDKSRYTLSGNMAEDVATIAKSQKGRTGAQLGYTEPWCDEFVADCIENAGADSSIVGHGGTVADFEAVMRKKGAVEVSSPQVGDLVFFTYSHVEIVTKVENGTVYCAGGNNGGTGNYKTNYCAGERKLYATARLYLRPNYKNTNVEPPTYSILYANKATITLNEDIVFTASSDYATGYLIGINDINGRYATENMPNGSLTMKFSKAGSYSAYVTSYNTAGYCDSALIYFTVIDSAPTFSQLTSSKNKILIDEEIEFNAISDNATAYWIGIDHNGERYLTKEMVNGTLKCSFSDAGVYTAYVTSSNAYGGSDSKLITFTVIDSAPTFSQLTSSTNKISIGEEIEFNAISDNATAYWIGIDHNGGRYLTKEMVNGTLKCSFSDAGVYTAYVTSSNKYGGIDSKLITFTVYINENEMIYNGDCNMDGNLNIIDIVLLQKFLTNVQDIDIADWKAADLSQDNILNISDLCIMKNKLLSIKK